MVDKDAVRRGYDDVAERYATERADGGRGMEILDHFLAPLTKPVRILDAGCGQGAPVLRQLSTTATAIGVDFSREQLCLAAKNAAGASPIQGDMTSLPICDGVFDAVTAYHSLIHVPIDDHRTVIDEFARVLQPDGRLLLSEGSDEWSGTNPDWLDSGVEMQWRITGAKTTREQLQNAGFTITNEWNASNTLAEDDSQWVFFAARLGI